ncbi:MAG: C-GCAxxG-C-C family protein [Dehalococcoidia bacterium]|nr:C-GCAxxG-C-C family protein [Dehalococcoidia bacterium]MDD5494510.1 C-GCAxxG-C-C family protein [Dehalococcoidia bacterium]
MSNQVYVNSTNFNELLDQRITDVLSSEANRVLVGELAYENFRRHYGCAQSMMKAFMDVLELHDDFWFKALGGLQGGGGCGLTCGALNTGFILINARIGRQKIEDGFKGLVPMLESCHQLAQWFKLQYKSTTCSEISGYDWLNTSEVIQQHLSEKGKERQENCARLTSGTAYKVAEILYASSKV